MNINPWRGRINNGHLEDQNDREQLQQAQYTSLLPYIHTFLNQRKNWLNADFPQSYYPYVPTLPVAAAQIGMGSRARVSNPWPNQGMENFPSGTSITQALQDAVNQYWDDSLANLV